MFLSKEIDCDTFLEQYLEQRTDTHLLKIKAEKLGEMLQNPQMHNWTPPSSQQTYPSNPVNPVYANFLSSQPPSAAPYPMYSSMPNAQSYLPHVSN